MVDPVLEVDGLRAAPGRGPEVLRGVELSVEAGEVVALLGASGAGKTTLVRTIAGLLRPADGRVRLEGRDVTGLPPAGRGLGVAFQRPGLWPHRTVLEHARLPAEARGMEDPGVRAGEALERARVPAELRSRHPGELSGGEARRVALARALAGDPVLLLLDEPFVDLETPLREELEDEVVDLCRTRRVGALVATHLREEALRMGDRLAILAEGRIVATGTIDDLRANPRHPETARLLGLDAAPAGEEPVA